MVNVENLYKRNEISVCHLAYRIIVSENIFTEKERNWDRESKVRDIGRNSVKTLKTNFHMPIISFLNF